MKKAIRWVAVIVGGLVGLLLLAALVIPMIVNVQHYKPYIEKKVTEMTGRPTTIQGDLHLSLFPWVGISFSDLRIGSGAGFKEKDLLTVKSFEVRIKLLPLLRKDVQVKRFVLEGPRVVLIKNKNGQANWERRERANGTTPQAPSGKEERPSGEKAGAFPIRALVVGEFAIRDGSLLWVDEKAGSRKEITHVSLLLEDVSLERPIQLAFSASVDGRPFSLDGKVGPLGKNPGVGGIPIDLSLEALKQIRLRLQGEIKDAVLKPQFDMGLQISPFSPRKVISELGLPFPLNTANPDALKSLALKARLKGGAKEIAITEGEISLDETKLNVTGKARNFSRPDMTFSLEADQIDFDGYLPPKPEKPAGKKDETAEKAAGGAKKTDYGPLRKMVLDGTIKVGRLKASGMKVQDFFLKISGKNGYFRLDPISVKLYDGDMKAKGALDVRQAVPGMTFELLGKGIQAGPLLKDFLNKDMIEGVLRADVSIDAKGDDAEKIKASLNSKGDLLFKDGSLKGIDLGAMVRNVEAAFGLGEGEKSQSRTDFSSLHVPFTIRDGVFQTTESTLVSPLLRVNAAGKANLVKENLEFRIEPKLVATLKGQGDQSERAGLKVPVLVTGSFSSPKFRPDLKGMIKGTDVQEILKDPRKLKEESKRLEENLKGLFKGLGSGN